MANTTLSATAASFIDAVRPNNNYASDNGINCGVAHTALPADYKTRALVIFDLTSLAGATITLAKLQLFASQNHSNANDLVCKAYRLTGSWTEGGVTWNNQPAYTSANASVDVTVPKTLAQNALTEFNVTAIVQDWIQSGQPNYGFIIIDNNEGQAYTYNDRIWWGSDEYLFTQYRPMLYVEYTSTTQASATSAGNATLEKEAADGSAGALTLEKIESIGSAGVSVLETTDKSHSGATLSLELTGSESAASLLTLEIIQGVSTGGLVRFEGLAEENAAGKLALEATDRASAAGNVVLEASGDISTAGGVHLLQGEAADFAGALTLEKIERIGAAGASALEKQITDATAGKLALEGEVLAGAAGILALLKTVETGTAGYVRLESTPLAPAHVSPLPGAQGILNPASIIFAAPASDQMNRFLNFRVQVSTSSLFEAPFFEAATLTDPALFELETAPNIWEPFPDGGLAPADYGKRVRVQVPVDPETTPHCYWRTRTEAV